MPTEEILTRTTDASSNNLRDMRTQFDQMRREPSFSPFSPMAYSTDAFYDEPLNWIKIKDDFYVLIQPDGRMLFNEGEGFPASELTPQVIKEKMALTAKPLIQDSIHTKINNRQCGEFYKKSCGRDEGFLYNWIDNLRIPTDDIQHITHVASSLYSYFMNEKSNALPTYVNKIEHISDYDYIFTSAEKRKKLAPCGFYLAATRINIDSVKKGDKPVFPYIIATDDWKVALVYASKKESIIQLGHRVKADYIKSFKQAVDKLKKIDATKTKAVVKTKEGLYCYDLIQRILKQKGFLYVKLEIEANLKNINEGCNDCHGRGHNTCNECDGHYERSDEYESECDNCDHGQVECGECDGSGYTDGDNDFSLAEFESKFNKALKSHKILPKYIQFYDDGSVNCEATLTIRIDYLDKVPLILRTFVDIADKNFDGFDQENSGFHITLLEGYQYPRSKRLPTQEINNFKKNMAKVIDALLIVASQGNETRPLYFRLPRISSSDKYSAVYTHNDTCIEYRVFDPILHQPKRFLMYMNVIARTLSWYRAKPKLLALNHKKISHKSDSSGNGMKPVLRLFNSEDNFANILKELEVLYPNKIKLQALNEKYQNREIGRTEFIKELTEIKSSQLVNV